ncbi:GTP pyrophosphokinase [Terrabacter sp. MAHUQ-38]|uniref:GTP pyrophosphokinase n=1 Tax=unclassified Terrabacter TaxID=2630222 RepID=UPI00272A6C71|nr:GTP pyrophosphokinase [Terrabacter sp. MAHUQ-38]
MTDADADVFGDALRHIRRTHLLSQRALAERLGVPPAASPASRRGAWASRSSRPSASIARSVSASARRAFPAHGVLRVGNQPTWWGARHGWGRSEGGDTWWQQDYRSPPELRARQDDGMSAHTPAEAYAELRPELENATALFVEMVTALLDEAGITYLSVTGRTKSVGSFAAKAQRRRDGELIYPHPLTDITDLIGVRVITYVHDDVAAVADLLSEELAVLDDRDMGMETARAGRFGYASRHLLVAVDASRTVPAAYESLRRRSVSVQIRTVLQHAWAEFEHDIRYKGSVPEEHASDLDRRFTLAAGLIELADREFSAIRDRLQMAVPAAAPPEEGEQPSEPDSRIGAQDLAKFLASTYEDAGWSRTDHYTWVSGLLLELGITTVEALAEVISPVDSAELSERMGYTYPPGAVRRLDDALLASFGTRYLDLEGNAHRRASLEARLQRMGTRN